MQRITYRYFTLEVYPRVRFCKFATKRTTCFFFLFFFVFFFISFFNFFFQHETYLFFIKLFTLFLTFSRGKITFHRDTLTSNLWYHNSRVNITGRCYTSHSRYTWMQQIATLNFTSVNLNIHHYELYFTHHMNMLATHLHNCDVQSYSFVLYLFFLCMFFRKPPY